MQTVQKEKIRDFIKDGITDERMRAYPDQFWQNLKNAGTELWLDTGDMDQAMANWSEEMTALTTNNTLINNEIQKGIYDGFIKKASAIVQNLPQEEQVREIAFILNARHGMRLARKFCGLVSVELHTGTAHDFDAIVDYGLRYHDINPGQFIVKVPYTATGLLGARRLRESGVKINFTLEFSARQNVFVSLITQPAYTNVFLGRLGAYMKDAGLGDGSGIGERAVLSSQYWISRLTNGHPIPTKLIAASLRNEGQLESLAGVDVFTMPTKVAGAGRQGLSGIFTTGLDVEHSVGMTEHAVRYHIEKVWEVTSRELEVAGDLAENLPANGKELVRKVREAGCGDMFPELSKEDYGYIASEGKIPNHKRWAPRIESRELAIDTLLNLAGLASFTTDQAALDHRILRIIEKI